MVGRVKKKKQNSMHALYTKKYWAIFDKSWQKSRHFQFLITGHR